MPFCEDTDLGRSTGNILAALATFFPPAIAEGLRQQCPIVTAWRASRRELHTGHSGHFFNLEPGVQQRLIGILDTIYEGFDRDERYPQAYNEHYRDGLPLVWLDEARLVVWRRSGTA